jgi:ribosome-binding factor A
MDAHRTGRVSEAVREELSEIIGFELQDPRLIDLVVTEVHVSPDMRHAHVKVGVEASNPHPNKALKALDHASNYLRHELATRLGLRRTPELHFTLDEHPEAPARVELLLKRARKLRGTDAPPQSRS